MAENLTPKKYIDDSNMKQILTAIKSKTPVGGEYVTEEQLLAKDYATKTYVGEQIVNAEHLKREIVTVLPTDEEASDNIIYMLKVESATGNDKYQEYMKIDGTVQMVGDTSVNLTDYAKTTDIPTTLPANGGNSDTVNNHTVKSDVPENAVFTDTVYDDTEVKGSIVDINNNFRTKGCNTLENDILTENKTDTCVLVMNSGKLQHRVIEIAPKVFHYIGDILNSDHSDIKGIGTATIILCGNGIAKIDFSCKIYQNTIEQHTFDYGINRNYFTNICGKEIQPLKGGVILYYNSEDKIDSYLQDFGSFGYPRGEFWIPSRIYDTHGTNGIWESVVMEVGTTLSGTLYGTY